MDTPTAIIVPLLAIVVLYFSMTIIRMMRTWRAPKQDGRTRADNSLRINLEDAKDRALTNLRDLDFEFRMGKLSQADYTELKERGEIEAMQVIKALDELP
tara:strand:+ start:809 stop:1108 length:300 start_codon:yes stop_codon:yes gene_type:complete